MELSASTFDLLTRLLSQLPDILLYPIFAPVQYLSSQKQDGKCIYTWVGTKMKCMQCIATNLPLSDGPSPYFVIQAPLIEIMVDLGFVLGLKGD